MKLGRLVALLEGRKVASCDVGGLRVLVVDAVKSSDGNWGGGEDGRC